MRTVRTLIRVGLTTRVNWMNVQRLSQYSYRGPRKHTKWSDFNCWCGDLLRTTVLLILFKTNPGGQSTLETRVHNAIIVAYYSIKEMYVQNYWQSMSPAPASSEVRHTSHDKFSNRQLDQLRRNDFLFLINSKLHSTWLTTWSKTKTINSTLAMNNLFNDFDKIQYCSSVIGLIKIVADPWI